MDIFKFNPTSPGKLEGGEIINKLKSKMWIERYRVPGEFTLVANANTGLREKLPIGSFVSHVDTQEVMIVENHEIQDDPDKETEIKVTGRGFESIFEQRIVGSNKVFPTSAEVTDYTLAADETWDQSKTLIDNHTQVAPLVDDNDSLPYFTTMVSVVGPGASVARIIKRADLLKAVTEILAVDDLGMQVYRPGPLNPLGAANQNTVLVIHKGVDRSAQVLFSYETGEIVSADYLWSNKKLKNTAYIVGKWVETLVTTASTFYDRRMMLVDAKDIDESFTAPPAGADLTLVVNAMQQRGIEALAAQKETALTKAEVSRTAANAKYRTDFNVGDLVRVDGNYNEAASMRISEYVEIEDGTGQSGYPTLTMA